MFSQYSPFDPRVYLLQSTKPADSTQQLTVHTGDLYNSGHPTETLTLWTNTMGSDGPSSAIVVEALMVALGT